MESTKASVGAKEYQDAKTKGRAEYGTSMFTNCHWEIGWWAGKYPLEYENHHWRWLVGLETLACSLAPETLERSMVG